MSHVSDLKVQVKDLDALADAAERCGCELVRGKTTYRWFGEFVGDSPMPEGFTRADLGQCEHAIRVKGNSSAYEVGVVQRRDGKGYTLLWDFWQGGYGLQEAIGEDGYKLKQEYSLAVPTRMLLREGYDVERTVRDNGEVELRCRN